MSTPTLRPGRVGRRGRTARSAAALLTALLPLAGCGGIDGITGGDTIAVTVELADSAGLFVGNDVGVLGVSVGEVSAIEPVGDRVEVTVEIDADQPVPADAGAVVVARSVATDRYLELTPVYDGGERLADGATIGLDDTRTPVDFDQVLESLNEFATGIGGSRATTDAVRRFIAAGTDALAGRGPLLNQTIHSLSEGVGALSGNRDDIAATVRSLDTLVATIGANSTTARTFIRQVARAAEILADERTEFRRALRALDRAVTTVAEFAVDNRARIVTTLDGSGDLMRTVLTKQDQLAEILRVMPLALQNIRLATGGDDRLPLRIDPLILDPLGGVLQDLCASLPGDLCDILAGTDPGADR